jgi:hypothetical protein
MKTTANHDAVSVRNDMIVGSLLMCLGIRLQRKDSTKKETKNRRAHFGAVRID